MSDTLVSPSLVHWFQDEQKTERAGSFGNPLTEFPAHFADIGWNGSEGVVVVRKLSKKEQAQAIAERKEQVADWETQGKKKDENTLHLFHRSQDSGRIVAAGPDEGTESVSVSFDTLATHARKLWTTSKGEWVKPQYAGVCCYRRGAALPASIYAYLEYNPTETIASFRIPVEERDLPDERSRLDARIRENQQAGRAGYSLVGLLALTIKLLGFGNSQADIERKLNVKRGSGQKLHAWALMCSRFAALNLLERLQMPFPTDSDGKRVDVEYSRKGYVPFGRLSAGAGRTLIGRAKPGKEDEQAKACIEVFTPETPAKPADVERFLQAVIENIGNADKVMEKGTIKDFADGCTVGNPWHKAIEDVLKAILVNDSPALQRVLDAHPVNKVATGKLAPQKAELQPVKASRKSRKK